MASATCCQAGTFCRNFSPVYDFFGLSGVHCQFLGLQTVLILTAKEFSFSPSLRKSLSSGLEAGDAVGFMPWILRDDLEPVRVFLDSEARFFPVDEIFG